MFPFSFSFSIYSLLLSFASLSLQSPQDGILFTTPNYPNPYSGKLSQRQYISVNSSQGVSIVFDQFLASAHDCVIACPLNEDACSSLCGDAMDHGLVPKILRVPGNASVTFVSIEDSDAFPHSGISAKIVPYDLEKLSFFDCNQEITLSPNNTFFLISQNYPSTPTTSFTSCSLKFSAKNIRIAVYDFYISSSSDFFRVTGENGQQVNITGFATEDEPVVYYFQNAAVVDFSISSGHSFGQKRFYILVNSYDEGQKSNDCVNTGNYHLGIGETVNFGTKNFGIESYANNLECRFSFTRDGNTDSLFALAISYESEKCADTMSIDGLSNYHEIYQGWQYSNLFFTYSRAISFLFESDPIIGGTGLNASMQHIDCTCPSSQNLTTNSTITSPSYTNSISYCPSVLCQPKIQFQDDIFDLQLDYTDISLRTYTLSNDTDSLALYDSYAHNVVKMNPGYVGISKFWATVSPVTVEFISQSLKTFPLDSIGRGFSINLNLVKKNYQSETIDFTEGNFFKDISNLDLSSGKTFQFSVNARKGHKISIYFFTKTTNQVFVDIFDSITSTWIDNKVLYSNVIENGPSLFLKTSGEKSIIRIRGNPTFLQAGTDFQAMITDIDQNSDNSNPDCGSLAYSLKGTKKLTDIHLTGKNCYKVLHYSDSSYSQSGFMNVGFSKIIDMQVFLGLNTYSSNLIAKTSNGSLLLPQDIFSNYLVLQYSTDDVISLDYSWDISSGIIARTMEPGETVILMSDDYGKINTNAVTQQFSVQLEGESVVQTGLQLEFISGSGKGEGTLTWSNFDSQIRKESFSSADPSLTLAACGNKLLVDYTAPGGTDKGLYLKIKRASLQCSSSFGRWSPFLAVFPILLSVLFL